MNEDALPASQPEIMTVVYIEYPEPIPKMVIPPRPKAAFPNLGRGR